MFFQRDIRQIGDMKIGVSCFQKAFGTLAPMRGFSPDSMHLPGLHTVPQQYGASENFMQLLVSTNDFAAVDCLCVPIDAQRNSAERKTEKDLSQHDKDITLEDGQRRR